MQWLTFFGVMFVVLMMHRSIFARNLVASLFVGFMSVGVGGGGEGVAGKCYVNFVRFSILPV